MRLLIVDDSQGLVDFYCDFFNSNGYETFGTISLTTAISSIENIDFDILISEYDFSGKSPFTLFKKFLSKSDSQNVIVLTKIPMTKNCIQKLNSLGIKTIFEKPILPNLLLATLERHHRKLHIFN